MSKRKRHCRIGFIVIALLSSSAFAQSVNEPTPSPAAAAVTESKTPEPLDVAPTPLPTDVAEPVPPPGEPQPPPAAGNGVSLKNNNAADKIEPRQDEKPPEKAAEKAAEKAPESAVKETPKDTALEPLPGPTPDAKALDNSGLSRATPVRVDGEHFKPLLFAPADNAAELGRPQLRWTITGGTEARLSGLKISASQIAFHLTQLHRHKSSNLFSFTKAPPSPIVTTVSFAWPQILSPNGVLTVENLKGDVLMKKDITEEDKLAWARYLKTTRAQERADYKAHRMANWGIADIDPKEYPVFFKSGNIRVCLSQSTEHDEKLRVCTEPFGIRNSGGDRVISKTLPTKETATVFLDGKPIGALGMVNFPEGKKISLGIHFNGGSSIEVTSQPIQLRIYDAVQSDDGQTVVLTGQGLIPIGPVKIIENPEEHFWSGTIVKRERVWQIAVPTEAPIIRVLGAFNIPFNLLYNAEKIPKESIRAYLADRQDSTYISRPTLYGLVSPNVKLTSNQASAKKTATRRDKNPAEGVPFSWRFAANKTASENRATIKLKDPQGQVWVAHHELNRVYPSEVSARLTGVVASSGQGVAMLEGSASTWFENLGFTDNRVLALQRWGVDAAYFKAITSIDLGPGEVVTEFSTLNANLKYNLTRGVWNRDEMFGVMLSAERITFSNLDATLYGAGAYWARTMPKVLNDIFNLLPLLNYSKYLEASFSYFPETISPGIEARTSYNLSFRGKVFFKPDFFGEIGAGIKQFDFIDNNKAAEGAFTTVYGLIGVGLLF